MSETTPVFLNLRVVTVTPLAVQAVKLTAKTGTRAAAVVALEIKEPAGGLSDAKLTAKPEAGATGAPGAAGVPGATGAPGACGAPGAAAKEPM